MEGRKEGGDGRKEVMEGRRGDGRKEGGAGRKERR
jgi:hypothetical protein